MPTIAIRGRATSLKDDRRNILGGRYKYVVTEPYRYVLDHAYGHAVVYKQHVFLEAQDMPLFEIDGNVLVVYPGYLTDGPSGATFDTDNAIAPAIMHDAVYQLLRMRRLPFLAKRTRKGIRVKYHDKYRKWADKDFLSLLKAEGMFVVRRRLWYMALRFGGAGAAKPEGGV